jgi:hypothetical protein
MGLVEPLVVHPADAKAGTYILLDGHMRLAALKELKIASARCIVATEDEAFTYNARINRLSPIQEHQMIVKAVRNGVSPERIAKALKLKIEDIVARMNLLDGIDPKAADLLKDKQLTPKVMSTFRKVSPSRQIDMAELMVNGNNFTKAYAEALFLGTAPDELVKSKCPPVKAGISPKEIARMEHEMEALEHDFKGVEKGYAQNILELTRLKGYLRRLLKSKKIERYLKSHHADMYAGIEDIALLENL